MHLGLRFIDFGIYDDGDIYESDIGTPTDFVTEREAHAHYLSVRLKYTAALVPGAGEAFKIHHIELRNAPDRQGSFTHEAFVDRVEFSQHLSAAIKHTGSEFIISHIQPIVQRKKHQPIG